MSELTWASERLQDDIAPEGTAQYVETRIRAAAAALKWSFSRTRTIWYADERASIKPREMRRITEVTGVEYGRSERREVDRLIANADRLLMGSDPDFHGPFVAAFRAFFSALDRTRVEGRDRPAEPGAVGRTEGER